MTTPEESLSSSAWPVFIKELDAFFTNTVIPALPKDTDVLQQKLKELAGRFLTYHQETSVYMATRVPELRASLTGLVSGDQRDLPVVKRVEEVARLTTTIKFECLGFATQTDDLGRYLRFLYAAAELLGWSVSLVTALKMMVHNLDPDIALQQNTCVIFHEQTKRALAAYCSPTVDEFRPTLLDQHVLEDAVNQQCLELLKHLTWLESAFVQSATFALLHLRIAAKCSVKNSYSS